MNPRSRNRTLSLLDGLALLCLAGTVASIAMLMFEGSKGHFPTWPGFATLLCSTGAILCWLSSLSLSALLRMRDPAKAESCETGEPPDSGNGVSGER